ncbi:MAG: TonB family protein [Mariprofundaceae bacterium]
MSENVILDKNSRHRLGVALIGSMVLHLALAAVITLDQSQPLKEPQPRTQLMDIVLLSPDQQSEDSPDKADALSNRSAKGSNSRAKDQVARAKKSPLANKKKKKKQTSTPTSPRAASPPEEQTKQRLTTLTREGLNPTFQATQLRKTHPKKAPAMPSIPLNSLMPSNMALAQLSRDMDRERHLKSMLSKEADISINTREAKYAPYARKLVSSLEEQWRPGQANYEDYQDLERRVLLRITIEHNGELSNLEILRPSPIARINESAISAIHAAAAFHPLPSSWGLDRATFYLTFEVIKDQFVFRAQ